MTCPVSSKFSVAEVELLVSQFKEYLKQKGVSAEEVDAGAVKVSKVDDSSISLHLHSKYGRDYDERIFVEKVPRFAHPYFNDEHVSKLQTAGCGFESQGATYHVDTWQVEDDVVAADVADVSGDAAGEASDVSDVSGGSDTAFEADGVSEFVPESAPETEPDVSSEPKPEQEPDVAPEPQPEPSPEVVEEVEVFDPEVFFNEPKPVVLNLDSLEPQTSAIECNFAAQPSEWSIIKASQGGELYNGLIPANFFLKDPGSAQTNVILYSGVLEAGGQIDDNRAYNCRMTYAPQGDDPTARWNMDCGVLFEDDHYEKVAMTAVGINVSGAQAALLELTGKWGGTYNCESIYSTVYTGGAQ